MEHGQVVHDLPVNHGFCHGYVVDHPPSGFVEESVRIAMLFFFDWNSLFAYTFALGWSNETWWTNTLAKTLTAWWILMDLDGSWSCTFSPWWFWKILMRILWNLVLPGIAEPFFPSTCEGLGWTGLELVFTVVQCLASIQLLQGVNRGDAQAIEAEI